MNCLCCGKPLRSAKDTGGWHKSCINRFFGTDMLPELDINASALELLALESTNKGLTVPGVQKKLSLHLMSEGPSSPRLTLVNYPTGYILKPQADAFDSLPEAEQLAMEMADISGISTVPHALVKSNGEYAYITKRIDRIIAKDSVQILAMEDFCQLDYRLTQDKYRGSYERCAKIIRKHSCRKGLDISELFMRLVFCYIIGNSDMHLKNFSLIETYPGSGDYALSAAYDLLPVNVVMPEDTEVFALAMNGKKTHIRKKDFRVFAESSGIPKVSADKMIAKLVAMKPKYIEMCEASLLPDYMKKRFETLIESRCQTLET